MLQLRRSLRGSAVQSSTSRLIKNTSLPNFPSTQNLALSSSAFSSGGGKDATAHASDAPPPPEDVSYKIVVDESLLPKGQDHVLPHHPHHPQQCATPSAGFGEVHLGKTLPKRAVARARAVIDETKITKITSAGGTGATVTSVSASHLSLVAKHIEPAASATAAVPPPTPSPARGPVPEAPAAREYGKSTLGIDPPTKQRDVGRMVLMQDSGEASQKAFELSQTMSYQTFRRMAPYIATHRGSVVVVHIPGEVVMGIEDDEEEYEEPVVPKNSSANNVAASAANGEPSSAPPTTASSSASSNPEKADAASSVSSVDDVFTYDNDTNFRGVKAEPVGNKVVPSRELAISALRDILLLHTLGVKPVIVVGCRPQIRRRLQEEGIKSFFAHGNRVCDRETLMHCASVAGHVRYTIESTLSRGLSAVPTNTGTPSIVSGNFVKAIPFGVRQGIDFKFTGIVQKLTNVDRMHRLLDEGHVLLLSHLGYSPSGEMFNCRSEDVAVVAAQQLKASKLIFLHNGECVVDERRRGARGSIVHNLNLSLAQAFESKLRASLGTPTLARHSDMDPTAESWSLQFLDYLQCSIAACKGGVRRVHMVPRHIEGSMIAEMYTREGLGTMVSRDVYEGVRGARPEDVQAIMALITPLEAQGILVTRPPEQVESEISKFIVFERDGEVLACCQLVHYQDDRYEGGAAEMCCVAVHESQRGSAIGSSLLSYCMRACFLELGCSQLFVLTTRSQSWFTDRGFIEAQPERLPPKKRSTYSSVRRPKIYFKHIESERSADEYDLLFN